MSNNRYNEGGDGAGLPQKVKGPKGSEASFKELGSDKDDSKSDPNGSGVKMPNDSVKHLPKAGETQ